MNTMPCGIGTFRLKTKSQDGFYGLFLELGRIFDNICTKYIVCLLK